MIRKLIHRFAPLLLVAMPFAVAHAGEIKVSGTGTYVTVAEDTTKLADGKTVTNFRQKGIFRSDDPSNPTHLSAADCLGTLVLAADKQGYEVVGQCAATDKDGDIWWVSWSDGAGGAEWNVVRGLGKYEGMTGGGTFVVDVETEDGRTSETYSGTLNIR